jgi:hypothetical protein
VLVGLLRVIPTQERSISKLNLVGAAGEYYVCAELCRLGVLAVLTPKNNPIFDVIATSADGRYSVTIQVKTRSVGNTLGWKLSVDIADPKKEKGQFVVLVNLHGDKLPDFYIYTPKELATRVAAVYEKYISTPKRDGSKKKDVGFRWWDEVSFSEADHARKNDWALITSALQHD